MACVVSVKRPHDFDPYMNCPEKRRKQSSPVHATVSKPVVVDVPPMEQSRYCGKPVPSVALEDYLRHEFGLRARADDGSYELAPDGSVVSTGGSQDTAIAGQPYFSLRQIRHVVTRLLSEQHAGLEEKFEKILQTRLRDQYVAFVNFTQDQIHRKLDSTGTPSYIS